MRLLFILADGFGEYFHYGSSSSIGCDLQYLNGGQPRYSARAGTRALSQSKSTGAICSRHALEAGAMTSK